MDAIITKLVEQLPSAVAILIVVVYFIRYIEKRDASDTIKNEKTVQAIDALATKINDVKNTLDIHHALTLDAVNDMKRTVRAKAVKGSARTNE
jgi:hypothetical protein